MDSNDLNRLRGALSTLQTLEHKARDLGEDILGDRLEVAVGYVMDALDEMPATLIDG